MQFKQRAVAEFIRQQRFVWQFVTIPAVGRVLRGFVVFSVLNWVSRSNRRPAAWRTDAYSR
jgi:hypothetical protein